MVNSAMPAATPKASPTSSQPSRLPRPNSDAPATVSMEEVTAFNWSAI
jgi:hypothetical protein